MSDEYWMTQFLRDDHCGAVQAVQDGYPFIHTSLFHYEERKHSLDLAIQYRRSLARVHRRYR